MPRPRRELRMARCAASALLAAIEIYNKPTVEYREQTFAVLMTNAWEVLLKARLVQRHNGKMAALYQRKPGSLEFERDCLTKNENTISLRQVLGRVDIPGAVATNILGLLEVRNQALHLGELHSGLKHSILRYGTASVENFTNLYSRWFDQTVDVPYLLPVGFLGEANVAQGSYPQRQRKLIETLAALADQDEGAKSEYSVVMQVDIKLNRGLSGGGSIGLTDNPNAPRVRVTDDELLERFPDQYNDVVAVCRERYPGFKQNPRFHDAMKRVKGDPACAYERKLDPERDGGTGKYFYNKSEVLRRLDAEYLRS